MEDIDIDGIMKGLSNPQVATNTEGIMDMIKEVNKVLGELQKTVDFLDKSGIKPLLVRIAGKQYGVDAETPLGGANQFEPVSDYHKSLFNQLNNMSVDNIKQMFVEVEKE